MGKGDRKTAKGKRNISSYGNARPGSATAKAAPVKAASPGKAKAAPAAPKKTVAKKAAAK